MLDVFPNLNHTQDIAVSRSMIYSNLEQVRGLRNRIAHHEPIFARNLSDDYRKVAELIGYRCPLTAAWIDAGQQASAMIAAGP